MLTLLARADDHILCHRVPVASQEVNQVPSWIDMMLYGLAPLAVATLLALRSCSEPTLRNAVELTHDPQS